MPEGLCGSRPQSGAAQGLKRMSALAAPMADLTSHDLAQLRATGQSLDVAFQVGKSGLSEGVVKELQARLSKEPLVKIKILAGARGEDAGAKELAQELAKMARVRLVEVRGFTALFYRPPRHQRGPDDF